MKPLLIDVWEGNPKIDVDTLVTNGVIGGFVRLNNMQGGHHMDSQFPVLWKAFEKFACRGLYFVYNPWVTGSTNFDWMKNNLPIDIGTHKIAIDLEVRNAGYSPVTYGREVAAFLDLCKGKYNTVCYTGGGFTDIMTEWPISEYWWARYPFNMPAGVQSWEVLHAAIDALPWNPVVAGTSVGAGPIKLWQICDHTIAPGFGNSAVDLNIFNGSQADAIAWINGSNLNAGQPVIVPSGGNMDKTAPKLIYVYEKHTEIDLAGLNGNIDGILALAVDRTRETPFDQSNGYISPMFTKQLDWANNLRPSVPAIAVVAVDPGEYIQPPLNDFSRWPPFEKDPVMVDVKRAICYPDGTTRKVSAIIFDMRHLNEGQTTKIVPIGRVLKIAERLQQLAWDNLKIFTMVLTDEQIMKQPEYQDAQSKNEISVFFMAHDDQNQSTVGECICWTGSVLTDSGNAIHFPLPSDNPNPHTPYAPTGNRLLLWWFSSVKVQAIKNNGVPYAVAGFTSQWTTKELYKMWNFTPITGTVVTPEPGNPPAPDNTDILVMVDQIVELAGKIKQKLQ